MQLILLKVEVIWYPYEVTAIENNLDVCWKTSYKFEVLIKAVSGVPRVYNKCKSQRNPRHSIFFGVFFNKSLHVIDIFFYINIYIAKLLTTVIFIYIYERISWWSFEL